MIKKINNFTKRKFWDIVVNSLASSYIMPIGIRKIIYNTCGIDTKTLAIRPNCYFGGSKVEIGKETSINGRCYFENLAEIKIGERCDIAMDVLFCTSTHNMGPQEKRAGEAYGEPIIVGNGCWIGARVTILPGVTIENGCIIAAGALVTKDCKANGLYVGSPAKRIKNLEELNIREQGL